jgi:hypothetical protein
VDDFQTDSDLVIACTVLQKQIDYINGNKENIVVPSVRMRKIHEEEQAGMLLLKIKFNRCNFLLL